MTDTKPTECECPVEGHVTGCPNDLMTGLLNSQPVPEENWLMKPALEWLEEAEHGADKGRCKMIADMLRYLWNNQIKITSDATQPVPVEPECVKKMRRLKNDPTWEVEWITLGYIDSLQSALQVAQQERHEAKAEAARANEYGGRAVREICALAAALHWPECWDTAAYPDLDSCIKELFICNTCRNGVA